MASIQDNAGGQVLLLSQVARPYPIYRDVRSEQLDRAIKRAVIDLMEEHRNTFHHNTCSLLAFEAAVHNDRRPATLPHPSPVLTQTSSKPSKSRAAFTHVLHERPRPHKKRTPFCTTWNHYEGSTTHQGIVPYRAFPSRRSWTKITSRKRFSMPVL
jgi:hypothetical protein